MEISQAKYFLYRDVDTRKVYKSKDFYRIFDLLKYKRLTSQVWAVLPTEQGDQLFEMDMSYSGEPMIFDRFMHIDSFFGFYRKPIDIDKEE